ncbi:hypothetical protein O1L55_33370, partial [Streptomyces albulus]|nr:hypothetical protein [Streptomyces noursei]
MNSTPSNGVPILRLGDVLVTGLLNELDDKSAVAFTEELTARITSDHARGVLIDISRLEIIDSFVARTEAAHENAKAFHDKCENTDDYNGIEAKHPNLKLNEA